MGEYNLKTSSRVAKPRSRKLRGFGGNAVVQEQATNNNGAIALAKLNSMFVLIDADGNEVSNVDEAVSVLVNNNLALASKEEIIAFLGEGSEVEGEGSGSVSASKLSELKDVLLTDLKDKQVLSWDAELGKWVNVNGGGSSTGAKPSYTLSEIAGAPSASKMKAWDDAADKRHSHNNLTNVLEELTVNHLKMLINLCNYVSFDSYGNITFEGNVIGKKEGTFFGSGTSAGGSGSTGGGESGGEGSGGGYEDGGNTGGGSTDGGTTSANWIMHMKDKLTISPIGYKKPNDIVIYHHDYFDQANDFGGKTIKKVIMRANTTGSSTLYIYAWYDNNYRKEYLTQIGSVSGANNSEISCNISIPANAKIAIKNSAGLAYAFNVSDRYGYVEYDSSADGYYYTAQMNKSSVFVDFYLE